MQRTKIVYVAGPYRADCEDEILDNIMNARLMAKHVWMSGGIAICPHLNTFFMGGVMTEDEFIEADLKIVERCDAILMIGLWTISEGAKREREHAMKHGIPIFTLMGQLRDWLKTTSTSPPDTS
jgi:hypothetical protein